MMKFDDIVDDSFSGCILVKRGDEIVFNKAYGYAELSNKIKNRIDTKFATASAGKVFVGVGILQLIEKGQLDFEDKVGNILDFDLRKIDKNITIRQLLSHTSGIPDYFDESVMNEYEELWRDYPNYKIRKSSDLIPLFIDKPMMYKAGERFQYNNTGFVVLGLIIEKITGSNFDEYLKDNIFEPSGMLDTGYYELDRLPEKCASSYIYDSKRNEYYTNIYSVDVKGTGAGGAFTTVLDVMKFWEYLLDGKLISENMLKQMLTPQSEGNYGYGIWLKQFDDNIYFPYFEGEDPGVSFISFYDIKRDINITLVSNFGCDVWELIADILNKLNN